MTCDQIIAVVANVITIFGGFLAFYVFKSWKHQQNYSFTRDKIFECELIFSRLLVTIEQYMEIYKDEVPFERNRLNNTNLELTNVLLAEVRKKLDPLWNEYELAQYSLYVLNVQYNRDKFPNFITLNGEMKRYIDTLNKTKTKIEVGKEYSFIRKSLKTRKTEGLIELKNLRENL
ncbi:hypothetical protein [Acinetobacter baumannii]|uniref:hypothetical protein n=1 Tax=Acinetobacter baumannii TaxID=470 RepID=UPI001C0C4F8F|nr:hypothetical protein [Acinetobacter baumannii]MBU3169541.1 hypothetical protein [Acinetobacter baumannii]HEM7759342.1 hypothetical protein [Acinetobacter baumannii]